MDTLFASLTVADEKRIAAALLIILANFVFAVVGAIARGGFNAEAGGFDLKKLPLFFVKQVVPYVLGLAFFEAYLHVQPLSASVATLFGSTAPSAGDVKDGVEAVGSSWSWIDPAALWTVYTAMMADLVTKLLSNLAYLAGKGIAKAQSLSADKPAG